MLTRWLTFTAFLVGSANPERAALTVAPTSRVKGHLEAELSLNCGDRKNAGVVQYWHTPFGDLQTPGFHSKLDPVYMHDDGSLVVPKASSLHSGLYYCLQQHTEGTTLWPYKLHVGHHPQNKQERSKNEKCSSCDAFRFKRDVGSGAQRQGGVSAELFTAAIIAAVLLTFVLGFSAGALSGHCIRRCLGLQSPRKQQGKSDMPDAVTRTTMTQRHDNRAFEMDHVKNVSSAKRVSRNSSASSSPPPPPKPQRSLRIKQEEQKPTAYLEGCDYVRGGGGRTEEVAGRRPDGRSEGRDGETEEGKEFYLSEDGGSQSDTNEDRSSDEGEERDRGRNREEQKGWRQEKEVKEAHEQENKSKEGRRESEAKERGEQKKGRDDKREEEEEHRQEREGDTSSEDSETGGQNQEGTKKRSPSPSRQARRSRVIRLYQYDDDGQRYSHLPDPAPDEPGPAPRHQQRSISMTRLNTIMAAASAGPLDATDSRREESSRFHVEI